MRIGPAWGIGMHRLTRGIRIPTIITAPAMDIIWAGAGRIGWAMAPAGLGVRVTRFSVDPARAFLEVPVPLRAAGLAAAVMAAEVVNETSYFRCTP